MFFFLLDFQTNVTKAILVHIQKYTDYPNKRKGIHFDYLIHYFILFFRLMLTLNLTDLPQIPLLIFFINR